MGYVNRAYRISILEDSTETNGAKPFVCIDREVHETVMRSIQHLADEVDKDAISKDLLIEMLRVNAMLMYMSKVSNGVYDVQDV